MAIKRARPVPGPAGRCGQPLSSLALPGLPGHLAADLKMGPDITSVLVYTCGHPAQVCASLSLYMCVLVGTVSVHRPLQFWCVCTCKGGMDVRWEGSVCAQQLLFVCLYTGTTCGLGCA